MSNRFLRRGVPPLVLLVALIVVWQEVTDLGRVPAYLVPGPRDIWQALLADHDLLLTNTVPTLEIALLGYAIALVAGLLLAIAIRSSRLLDLTIYPVIITSQAIPVLALAPILVVVLGFTILPKLIVVALICFFPITVNAVDGFRSVDPALMDLLRTMGARRWRLFREVEWPSALPFIFSGARVAVTYCVIGAIFGEWVGSSEGLGWLMIQKQAQFDIPGMFAAVTILALLGIMLFAAVTLLERLLLPWYHNSVRDTAPSGRGR